MQEDRVKLGNCISRKLSFWSREKKCEVDVWIQIRGKNRHLHLFYYSKTDII